MFEKIKTYLQGRINAKNRLRLTNVTPSLICSNCTGGFLYHWLGLRFNSPFINLYMTNEDFISALENWNSFIRGEIIEVQGSGYSYPVGEGYGGVKIHFVHYKSFSDALVKWKERCKRIDERNLGIMLTNWGGVNSSLLERFDRLPFKHKVVFVEQPYPQIHSAFCLRGFSKVRGVKNIYATQYINGRRYIDQFDYVSFINSLKESELRYE